MIGYQRQDREWEPHAFKDNGLRIRSKAEDGIMVTALWMYDAE